MRFSDWQLNRLRDGLRAYHRYGRGADGSYFNWKDVSEAIVETTDIAIPPERLRQFVEGVNTKEGGRKFPVPQDAWLEAIVAFALHEDNALLTEAELKDHAPSWHAAQRLLDYLDQAFDTMRIMPPVSLEGTYQVRRLDEDGFEVGELTLQLPSDDGLIQVVKTASYYDAAAAERFDGWSEAERREQRNSRLRFAGWAILTPEDNLMLFLKNERNGANRYHFTLASDLSHAAGARVTQLVLLAHDYPLEPDEGAQDRVAMTEAILAEAARNILFFHRIM